MKIAAGYPHVVTVSTCKWTHVKISFFFCIEATRNFHNVTCANPLHRACSAPAVLSNMFNTIQEEGPGFLDPVIFNLILCGFFDVLTYLQTAHPETPHFLLPWHFFKCRAVWETESVKSTWQHVYSCICVQRSLLCVSFNSAIVW